MNNEDIEYFKECGYDVVTPARLFGRSSTIETGEPITEGGYREVTIEEMFGTTTERGNGGEATPFSESLTATPLFQSIVLASLVVYLTIVIRSWKFIRSIWTDIFKTNNEERMVFEGGELPLQRFKLTSAILGLALLALSMVRIADGEIPANSEIYTSTAYMYAPLIAVVVMLGYVIWNYAYHKCIGWVIESDTTAILAHIGYTNFVRSVVLLYPIIAIWLLTETNDGRTSGIALIICVSILFLLYLKDTILFFLGKKISIFFWILYLCTAILLPWSIIVKLLALQTMA